MNKLALEALTTPEELSEALVIGKQPIKLRRTFNQSDFKGGYVKFWRVIGPAGHPSLNSDISTLKLKEWGLI